MATVETGTGHRSSLPSINHLDLDKYHYSEKAAPSRYSTMPNLSIATTQSGSPTTIHSGPPPPYSSTVSATGSAQGLPGYISPPESNSRRSTRDEKDSPSLSKALPSISEALKSAADLESTPRVFNAASAPTSAVVSSFGDAPRGPGNPFLQSSTHSSLNRSSYSSSTGLRDPPQKSVPPPLPPEVQRQQHERPMFRSPFDPENGRPAHHYHETNSSPRSVVPPSTRSFSFEVNGQYEEPRNPFVKDGRQMSYGETVKRHLDVYDAELALNELGEASARTLDFSKYWIQRYHQSNRSSYFCDGLPSPVEIDDMMRQSHRVMESLSRIREVAITQQNALSEQRARAARGNLHEDEYGNIPDEYKTGGFAGGDAKKRRGKAAAPGRCHSCNRAETPEWRRGPDGARTLCNACGLHYAKLTRKMGANKAAIMTGSSLRPKSLNETRP